MPNPENLEGQGFHTDPNRINKEGRPKGSRNLSSLLKEMLEQEITVEIDGKKERKTFQEAIVQKLLKKANDGDIKAITEIFDRTEGKAQSKVDLTTNGKELESKPSISITIDSSEIKLK